MVERENRAISAKVRGIVQGVGFRYSTLYQAKHLNLNGYVRNLADGSVEVIAEGKKEKIENFLLWLKKGPPGAYVQKLDYRYIPYKDLYRGFSIEY